MTTQFVLGFKSVFQLLQRSIIDMKRSLFRINRSGCSSQRLCGWGSARSRRASRSPSTHQRLWRANRTLNKKKKGKVVAPAEVVITDALGREVTMETLPQRIVVAGRGTYMVTGWDCSPSRKPASEWRRTKGDGLMIPPASCLLSTLNSSRLPRWKRMPAPSNRAGQTGRHRAQNHCCG